jgi:hypothetical protein
VLPFAYVFVWVLGVYVCARACVFFQKPNALCFLVFSYIIIVAAAATAAALLADLFFGRLLT